jgi:hypothetical protein
MCDRDRVRHLSRVLVILLALGCESPAKTAETPPVAKAAASAKLPPASDYTYGVYLNGAKVGWMRATTSVGREVTLGMNLEAAVGGMGQVSRIVVSDTRTYDAASGALIRLAFVQEAATGAVRIEGVRDGNELVLTIRAGNAAQTQRHPVQETLEDALAPMRLAQDAKPGESRSVHHFDASLQKNVAITHRTAGLEEKMLAGVATKAVRVESNYPELGVVETAWMDDTGKVLESQVGGFFVARLEPPDVARRLDYQQDLLVSAVVKTPQPLAHTAELSRFSVTFAGFGDQLPPASERQKVTKVGDTVRLDLNRETALPPLTLAAVRQTGSKERDALSATPFIQSDAPAIKSAAEQAIAGATTLADAVPRLTEYVFRHVEDEYVPAYSNALEALESGRGDCTEHSVLFVALARALGIPARVAVGIAYWPPGSGFGWHAWAEIYAGGRWYTVDPTWNQPIADPTHVKLADGGPAEQARIVMLLGRLKVVGLGS